MADLQSILHKMAQQRSILSMSIYNTGEIGYHLKSLGIPAGETLLNWANLGADALIEIQKLESEVVYERFAQAEEASNNIIRAVFATVPREK